MQPVPDRDGGVAATHRHAADAEDLGVPAVNGHHPDADRPAWEERSRIVLTPVAAPSILGLFAFGAATLMVGSLLAGWWGDPVVSPLIIAPFAFAFGGLAQLLAGMWAYRARDGLATAMHGTWGSFWLAWGFLVLLIQVGALPPLVLQSQAFGFWFIGLTVITLFGAIAAATRNAALTVTLGLLTVGSALLAVGLIGGFTLLVTIAGWALVIAAAAALYTAGAMLLVSTATGRTVLPLGTGAREGDVPGGRVGRPIEYVHGMPGAKAGQ